MISTVKNIVSIESYYYIWEWKGRGIQGYTLYLNVVHNLERTKGLIIR